MELKKNQRRATTNKKNTPPPCSPSAVSREGERRPASVDECALTTRTDSDRLGPTARAPRQPRARSVASVVCTGYTDESPVRDDGAPDRPRARPVGRSVGRRRAAPRRAARRVVSASRARSFARSTDRRRPVRSCATETTTDGPRRGARVRRPTEPTSTTDRPIARPTRRTDAAGDSFIQRDARVRRTDESLRT